MGWRYSYRRTIWLQRKESGTPVKGTVRNRNTPAHSNGPKHGNPYHGVLRSAMVPATVRRLGIEDDPWIVLCIDLGARVSL